MRDKRGSAFALSPDAASVRFGLGYGEEKSVLFDLAAASLTDLPNVPPKFLTAKVDSLPVTDWEDNYAPKFNGARLAVDDYEKSRALAVRSDASGFALGADWSVRAFDPKGKERWNKPGPGVAFGVDFSRRRRNPRRRLQRRHDPLAALERRGGIARLVRRAAEPQMGRLDAVRLLHGLRRRRGPDRLARQSRLGHKRPTSSPPRNSAPSTTGPTSCGSCCRRATRPKRFARRTQTSDRAVPAKPVGAALPPVVAITSPAGRLPFLRRLDRHRLFPAFALRPADRQARRVRRRAKGSRDRIRKNRVRPSAQGHARRDCCLAERHELVAHRTFRRSDERAGQGQSRSTTDRKRRDRSLRDSRSFMPCSSASRATQTLDYNNIHFRRPRRREPRQGAESAEGRTALRRRRAARSSMTADSGDRPSFDGLYWLQHAATRPRPRGRFSVRPRLSRWRSRSFWFLTREADSGRLPYDRDLQRSIFSMSFPRFRGKKVVFIDACHAGAAIWLAGVKGDSENDARHEQGGQRLF